MSPRLSNLLVRVWRLAALAAAALLLHRAAVPLNSGSAKISLAGAREFFPSAARLHMEPSGAATVRDGDNETLGMVVTTSPEADHITGYSGPSNLLVALGKDGRILGSKIIESEDTPAHVESLRQRVGFSNSIIGWKPSTEPPPKIEGISGSTLTGLAMVEGIAARIGGTHGSLRFPERLSLGEVRDLFPGAASFLTDNPRQGWHRVITPAGSLAGYVVRTAPASDGITGYAGPTECLASVEPDGQTLREVRIRKSYDSDEYVDRVVMDRDYLKSLSQWKVSQWPTLDFAAEKIEGVAGATLTSAGIAEGLRERFKLDVTPLGQGFQFSQIKNGALVLLLLLAGLQAFTGLRGTQWVRVLWQAVLIGVLGLWLGQFLSLSLLAGWAQHGAPWRQAAPLVALAAAAFLVPWGTRRQIYCHHVCPHGAAQEWLGRLSKHSYQLPPKFHAALRLGPGLLLSAAFLGAVRFPFFPLGNLEPFDFWSLGKAVAIPAVLALGGLALSAFVPMAYCRYGCPTGALLGFIRSSSSREVFTKRDTFAALVLFVAWILAPSGTILPADGSIAVMRGTGFGTTWCVKLRDKPANAVSLHASLAAEVKRIESTLSHWSMDSATSRFNVSTSTEEQAIPEELGRLVAFALRAHQATSGAYDITVSPLVSAWGYGPAGEVSIGPSNDDLKKLLAAVGSEKLTLSSNGTGLRKSHPALALDLGSLLQGYAVDKLCGILVRAGCNDYLVEVGGEFRAKNAWSVAIENPADARNPLAVIELKDSALATSGLARARKRLEGQPVSHIISPKTGRPVAQTIEACSVQRPTCLEADVWSTAVIATGLPEAEPLARREGLTVWILDTKGLFKRPE